MCEPIKAPFPWFGGKSRAADLIWERMGQVDNYVEPFAGSLAVLLGSPYIPASETVNDADGFVANFWRATIADPEAVAHYCDWPVNENDLHARHAWLVAQRDDFTRRLEGDPNYSDAKVAGWWCWGICCWIGSGWCSGNGPWGVDDGQLVHLGDRGRGVKRQRVHLGNRGQGVNRQLVHLGDRGQGVKRKLVHLGDRGQGVNRKRVHLGDRGRGGLYQWFEDLRDRLRHVRVCCGDWTRVCGPTPTVKLGTTAVVLDPPYADTAQRSPDLYAQDSLFLAHDVREWAVKHGTDKRMRIALCGYDGEHDMPGEWEAVAWRARGGYGSQSLAHDNPNAKRERIWFSPHCEKPASDRRQVAMFSEAV